MTSRYFIYFLTLCIALCSVTSVQAKKKKSKKYIKLVEAYTQRVLPGRPGSPTMTGTHFIIIWKCDKYPETFFWRGDNGWLSCKMSKAHKIAGKKNVPKGMDYRTEIVTDANDIHKGDTLELSPVTGGKFPIPAEIPAAAKNTIFYKTNGSAWLQFPVKKITKKPDAAMP